MYEISKPDTLTLDSDCECNHRVKDSHPLIKACNDSVIESEIIKLLNLFFGVTYSSDKTGEKIIYVDDQTESFYIMMYVFSYGIKNQIISIISWIMKKFFLLNVSYDNNFYFNDCLKNKNYRSMEMIIYHFSFSPDKKIILELVNLKRFDLILECMDKINLPSDILINKNIIIDYIEKKTYHYIHEFLKYI